MAEHPAAHNQGSRNERNLMTDRYMTAEEFTDALADTSHTMVGKIDGSELGTRLERITRIELHLSNGRGIEISCDTNIDHEPELLLSEVDRHG